MLCLTNTRAVDSVFFFWFYLNGFERNVNSQNVGFLFVDDSRGFVFVVF